MSEVRLFLRGRANLFLASVVGGGRSAISHQLSAIGNQVLALTKDGESPTADD